MHVNGIIDKALLLIRLILFGCFFSTSVMICMDVWNTLQTVETCMDLQAAYKEMGQKSPEDWSHGMLALNPDYVGWLTIPGTNIDGPVVQGEDNTEYLRTDFYGESASAGTFFMDELVDMGSDGNRIIYGHLMNDGTMFAQLARYKEKAFLEENPYILLETAEGTQYYQLFAGMVVSGTDFPVRTWLTSQTTEQERKMLDTISGSAYYYQENLMSSGPYLFLATCDYQQEDGRLVLAARKL